MPTVEQLVYNALHSQGGLDVALRHLHEQEHTIDRLRAERDVFRNACRPWLQKRSARGPGSASQAAGVAAALPWC